MIAMLTCLALARYVSVTLGIAFIMMIKAMFSVAIRVPVLALFIGYAGPYAAIYFGLSYLAGANALGDLARPFL